MRSDILENVLEYEKIGRKFYTDLTEHRLRGKKSDCEPMKIRKFKTFMSMNKVDKNKVQEKVAELKEDRSLISKDVIAPYKRPEIFVV